MPKSTYRYMRQTMTEQPAKTRTLFAISDDLEKLGELLEECADNIEQRELIDSWFEHLASERDRKLDNYCALIGEMLARVEARRVEAKRLTELATTEERRTKLLKDRLLWFCETHNLKVVETPRYRL